MSTAEAKPRDFIRTIVEEDLRANKNGGRVVTRFPPEPNGYLHVGHAISVWINFGIAAQYGGVCHLRFDDTNPAAERTDFVEAIKRDVHWLGYDWGEHLYFASDYFEQLYEYAEELIRREKAYVCSLSAEQMREYRGTLTRPGRESPCRSRSVEENLDLFRRMRAGDFADGEHVLRARIDMASPNINMRDPTIYRIMKIEHHRTGDRWCIYPMYDYAHCLSDSIEGITHSICTLEFEDHRPLYDWFLDELEVECHPQQIEFARLNVSYTIMSKRRLRSLVEDGHVADWDDPRMPTIAGMRRRGCTPASLRLFLERAGLAKRDKVNDLALLEHSVREDLNRHAPRVMAVLDPLRVVIENYPEGQVEELDAVNNPEDESMGMRKVPFARELYIDRNDFREEAPRKFHRLTPGREVRLRWAYLVTCTDVVKDEQGNVVEVRCTYDPETRGGSPPDGRKVKGTIHWVSAAHSLPAAVRLYDRLFTEPAPDSADNYLGLLNPESLVVVEGCRVEPSLASAAPGDRVQFERTGYFCVDPDSAPGRLVFNRTVPLRDTWSKIEKQMGGAP